MTLEARSMSVTFVVTNSQDPTSCFNTKSSPTEKICPLNVLNAESVYAPRPFWKFTWEVYIARRSHFPVKCVDSDRLALTILTFTGSKCTTLLPRWCYTSIAVVVKSLLSRWRGKAWRFWLRRGVTHFVLPLSRYHTFEIDFNCDKCHWF